MPTVTAQGNTFECPQGANLRRVLLHHDVALYNGQATLINCRGIGTCGTCAVVIDGEVSPMAWREQARLGLPPHSADGQRPAFRGHRPRRLACQVQVLGDVQITKYDGFWGHGAQIVWTPGQNKA
jgi:ferredoxin